MKPWHWFAALGAVLVVVGIALYASVISADQNVKQSFGEIQTTLQRRNDLIPNLVETAKGYTNFERGTLTELTEMRSKAGQILSIDVSEIADNPELQKQLFELQSQMSGALTRLLATAEAYPDLKASTLFEKLQDELAGSENRIAQARRKAQEAIASYNNNVLIPPTSLIASMFGFKERKFFEAAAGAEDVPVVSFN